MPTFDDHMNQAKHNKEVSELLILNPVYYDWAMVTIFYSSLHLIEALIVDEYHNNTSQLWEIHNKRNQYHFMSEFIRIRFSQPVWTTYNKFQTASMRVRYLHNYQHQNNIPSHCYYSKNDVEIFVGEKFNFFTRMLSDDSQIDMII